MVSHIELAKKNNVSVEEIHQRSIALNKIYFLDVFKSADDNKWYGGVWKKEKCTECRKNECQGCVQRILTLPIGFNRPQFAACYLNKSVDNMQLSSADEQKLGLSNADFALLKKLEVRSSQKETANAFQMRASFERALY